MPKPPVISPDAFRQQFIGSQLTIEGQQNYIQVLRLEETIPHLSIPTQLHRPTFDYLVLYTQGEGSQRLNFETYPVDSQTVLYIAQGSVTAIEQVSTDTQGYFLRFSIELLRPLFNEVAQTAYDELPPTIQLSTDTALWCRDLCELLLTETRQQNSPSVLSALLLALLQKLMLSSGQTALKQGRADVVTQRFRRLVRQHGHQMRPVSFFCDQLAVSEGYLLRCVKSVTGQSPKEIIADTAILYAKLLLQTTTLTVAEIAYETGFDDASYFGRLFRKLTGQTPSGFRHTCGQLLIPANKP